MSRTRILLVTDANPIFLHGLPSYTLISLDHWFPLGSMTTDGLFLKLQIGGTAPADSMLGTGWHVDGLASGNYSRMAAGVVRDSSTFSGTAQPSGGPDAALGDGWRTENKVTLDLPAGDWTLPFPFIASAADQEGADVRVRVRLWYSDNADMSSPTEITSGASTGTTCSNLQSESAQISTVTISLGAVSFTEKYFCAQVALETL